MVPMERARAHLGFDPDRALAQDAARIEGERGLGHF